MDSRTSFIMLHNFHLENGSYSRACSENYPEWSANSIVMSGIVPQTPSSEFCYLKDFVSDLNTTVLAKYSAAKMYVGDLNIFTIL